MVLSKNDRGRGSQIVTIASGCERQQSKSLAALILKLLDQLVPVFYVDFAVDQNQAIVTEFVDKESLDVLQKIGMMSKYHKFFSII